MTQRTLAEARTAKRAYEADVACGEFPQASRDTLTYVHLLDGDVGEPLEPLRVNTGSTDCPQTAGNWRA